MLPGNYRGPRETWTCRRAAVRNRAAVSNPLCSRIFVGFNSRALRHLQATQSKLAMLRQPKLRQLLALWQIVKPKLRPSFQPDRPVEFAVAVQVQAAILFFRFPRAVGSIWPAMNSVSVWQEILTPAGIAVRSRSASGGLQRNIVMRNPPRHSPFLRIHKRNRTHANLVLGRPDVHAAP